IQKLWASSSLPMTTLPVTPFTDSLSNFDIVPVGLANNHHKCWVYLLFRILDFFTIQKVFESLNLKRLFGFGPQFVIRFTGFRSVKFQSVYQIVASDVNRVKNP
ncbi:MAG: hypothetical protein LJE96_10730, partial [Deltaproteobacteria bacterium]|nr:hypothetical protein [Deltaproteobacteria bacterium]